MTPVVGRETDCKPALLHARVDPVCEVSPILLSGQALDAMWRWNP
jgi:hypothetical protein